MRRNSIRKQRFVVTLGGIAVRLYTMASWFLYFKSLYSTKLFTAKN